jgi:hypothetical protein
VLLGAEIPQWYSAGPRAGCSGGSSPGRGWEFFSLPPCTDRLWGPPPIHLVPGALSLGGKRPGREADKSPPSSGDVKNEWSYTFTPPVRVHGVMLS